jgi:transcription initiation factor TFIIB
MYPETYNPTEFIVRIANGVSLSERTERLAFKILEAASEKNVSASKNPMAMAAAAVHLASIINAEKVSQLKISEISQISAVTIRDRTKEIREKIGGEIIG